jgi:hypothetical protein
VFFFPFQPRRSSPSSSSLLLVSSCLNCTDPSSPHTSGKMLCPHIPSLPFHSGSPGTLLYVQEMRGPRKQQCIPSLVSPGSGPSPLAGFVREYPRMKHHHQEVGQEVQVPGEVFNFMCMCLCAGLVAVLFGIIDAYTPRGRQCQPYPMRAGMFVVLFAIILTRCTSPALPCG